MNSNPFGLLHSALVVLHKMMHETRQNPRLAALELIEMMEYMVRGVCFQETNDNGYYAWINTDLDHWISDLSMFITSGALAIGYQNTFFRRVACPAMVAHASLNCLTNPHRKLAAMAMVEKIPACALKTAMVKWITNFPAVQTEPNVQQS